MKESASGAVIFQIFAIKAVHSSSLQRIESMKTIVLPLMPLYTRISSGDFCGAPGSSADLYYAGKLP